MRDVTEELQHVYTDDRCKTPQNAKPYARWSSPATTVLTCVNRRVLKIRIGAFAIIPAQLFFYCGHISIPQLTIF